MNYPNPLLLLISVYLIAFNKGIGEAQGKESHRLIKKWLRWEPFSSDVFVITSRLAAVSIGVACLTQLFKWDWR